MYLEHFGMREFPFQLTPNTRFRFSLPSHHEALNVLMVTLRSGEGFVKIVGEVGTGKTLLCRTLLNELGDEFVTAYIPDPCLSPLGVRLALAEELGVKPAGGSGEHAVMRRIHDRLAELRGEGKQAVLLMDEAQALPRASLESLRLLTNLETETTKLLQIVLFGQPELDLLLEEPALRQLRQRITFSYRLRPMSRLDLEGYVVYRLALAGTDRGDLFTESALNLLHRASRGVPRLVHILCHKALLAAYGNGEQQVQRRHVRTAISDTESIGPRGPRGWRRFVAGVFPRRLRAGEWSPRRGRSHPREQRSEPMT